MNTSIEKQIKKAPKRAGIYIFKNKTGEILYIGKAGNLRNRVRQYLKPDPERPFLEHLMKEAEKLELKTTGSEIEALILESRLIKERQPKYNVALRDGKRHFYVGFSNEDFPKAFITHQPTKLGPFTDGTALRTTLRLLRRIFLYCTCKQKHNNFCLNYHIGKCPGYCCLKKQPEKSQVRNYRKNIKAVMDILAGKKDSVIKNLKKEIDLLARNKDFEKAIEMRDKMIKLEKVFENAKIIRDAKYRLEQKESILDKLALIFKLPKPPGRIEGYDISNIQGKDAVGSMVVFVDGQPDKNEYRKFKIRLKNKPDDIAMLKEVLTRRFKHSGMPRTPKPSAKEWPRPDLIFVDGGIAQLNAAKSSIINYKLSIPIISLAKGKKEIFSTTLKKPVPLRKLLLEIKNLILHIDSEAHRFAISYYRKVHRRHMTK